MSTETAHYKSSWKGDIQYVALALFVDVEGAFDKTRSNNIHEASSVLKLLVKWVKQRLDFIDTGSGDCQEEVTVAGGFFQGSWLPPLL